MTAGREALHIFRKDAALFWRRAALFWALAAWVVWRDTGLPGGSAAWYTGWLLDGPIFAACFYLAAGVIQAEGLAGECPYWVTRPFSRSGLAAGHALVLALLNAAVLAAQFWSLSAPGVNPLDHLSLVFWRQAFFTARVVLPAAALAAVTRDRLSFTAFALLYLAVSEFPIAQKGGAGDWGGWEWMRASGVAALAGGVALATLVMQYRRRRTGLARRILAAGAIAIGVWQLLPWRVGFVLASAFSTSVPANAARMVFAPARGTSPAAGERGHSRRGVVGLAIPVEAAGIPEDQGVRVEGTRTVLEAGGERWDSGWRLADDPMFVSAAGPYWLRIDLPSEIFRRFRDAPVRLRTTLALTLLADPTSTELELGGARLAMGTGVCWTHPAGGNLTVVCSSPDWRAARSTLRVQSQSTGQSVAPDLSTDWPGVLDYGPYPARAGLILWKNRVTASLYAPPLPIGIILDTRAPAGFAERTLEAAGMRLAAYEISAGKP